MLIQPTQRLYWVWRRFLPQSVAGSYWAKCFLHAVWSAALSCSQECSYHRSISRVVLEEAKHKIFVHNRKNRTRMTQIRRISADLSTIRHYPRWSAASVSSAFYSWIKTPYMIRPLSQKAIDFSRWMNDSWSSEEAQFFLENMASSGIIIGVVMFYGACYSIDYGELSCQNAGKRQLLVQQDYKVWWRTICLV